MDSLDEIANKANKYLTQNVIGFKKCTADNETKCLIFEFDTEENAEGFKFYRELLGVKFKMCVMKNILKEHR